MARRGPITGIPSIDVLPNSSASASRAQRAEGYSLALAVLKSLLPSTSSVPRNKNSGTHVRGTRRAACRVANWGREHTKNVVFLYPLHPKSSWAKSCSTTRRGSSTLPTLPTARILRSCGVFQMLAGYPHIGLYLAWYCVSAGCSSRPGTRHIAHSSMKRRLTPISTLATTHWTSSRSGRSGIPHGWSLLRTGRGPESASL